MIPADRLLQPPADRDPDHGPAFSGRFGTPPRGNGEKTRRRRTTAIFLAFVAALLLIGFLRNAPGGGGISSTKIGPLEIGKATPADARLRFGLALDVWKKNGGAAPIHFRGELWRYGCSAVDSTTFGVPCRTLFGFRDGRLQSVSTVNQQFSTKAGTRIGSTVAQAVKRDHGKWSGSKASCPIVTFPSPGGIVFAARVFRNAANPGGVVSGFYLSTVPGSFEPCAT